MSIFTGKVAQGADLLQSGDNTQVMRILVVEDEERLARLISRVLVEEGYAVETEANGRQALMRALADEYDLLIVDWMLPELSGVQLVKRLRAAEVGTPAIMLTARDQIEDRVEGLDAGADDYLPKPFAFPELLARVRALARRPWGEVKDGAILGAGDVTLDPVRHVVRHRGETVDLTAKEFALLATLLQRPGQVFTPARFCSIPCGAPRPKSTPTSSTSTSPTCARSSTATVRPPTSEPSGVSVTRSSRNQDRADV
jgi:DNA-binding response OmpR family regulator